MAFETNDAFAETFTEICKAAPPRCLGIRFDMSGTFLPTPGNTVVSHVVAGSRTQAALARLRQALMDLPHGDRFAYTPVSSYHMTVFQGVVEGRRQRGFWPENMPADASIEETTAYFIEQLQGFPPVPPFRMTASAVTPLGLVLAGATPKDERVLRELRQELTVPFGYRHPDHDSHRFHITLAYPKAWLPAGTEETYLPALASLRESFAEDVDTIELGAPAFCVFPDMTEFTPLRFL